MVPGNHDRMSDNVAAVLSYGDCWLKEVCDGALRIISIDSTHPLNATLVMAQGELSFDTCNRVIELAREAPENQSVLVLVHHHLVRTSVDNVFELLAEMKRLPFAQCLRRGRYLASSLSGHVAAVLHGHRHKSAVVDHYGMPIINAGSTTELCGYRLLQLEGNAVVSAAWQSF